MSSVITVENLYKEYKNSVKAVNGLNLSVNRGEVFGLLGPNGAGKSTTISILVGHLQASAGSVNIAGMDLDDPQLRNLIGYVPQEIILYPRLTVKENLQLFSTLQEVKNSNKRIDEIISLLELTNFVSQQVKELSGGQKRRVNLAVGLLNSPEILFLDEPSAGMDPQSRNILWESIEKLSKSNITIILTTHLMEVADRLCDRIAIVDHGEILIEGSPNELKDSLSTEETIILKFDNDVESEYLDQLATKLENENDILTHNHTIQVLTDISNLDQILKEITEAGLKPHLQDVTIRSNTLEDVFITLTGKTLRE